MALNSSVASMCCVVWRIKPSRFRGRTISSKPFPLANSEWKFQMNVEARENYIEVSLSLECTVRFCVKPFIVTTSVRDGSGDSDVFPSQEETVGSRKQHIWSHRDYDNRFRNKCQIICLFQPTPSLDAESTEDEMTPVLMKSQRSPSIGADSLFADFKNLLKDSTYQDVILRCGGRTMPAHRVVLAGRSEVFAAMFRNKLAESEDGVVDIVDLDPEVLELFLEYLYCGKIPKLSEDTVSSLYSTGDKYAVRSLQMDCSTWILRHLTRENCLDYLLLADAHGDEDFKDKVAGFIARNPQMLKGEAWSTFKEKNTTLAFYVYDMCIAKKIKDK